MTRPGRALLASLLATILGCGTGRAAAAAEPDSAAGPLRDLGHTLARLPRDQAELWTAPLHLHASDAMWLVPLGGATAALLATDRQAVRGIASDSTLRDAG